MKQNRQKPQITRGEIVNLFSPELSTRSRLVIIVEELMGNEVSVQLTDTINCEVITVNKNQLRKRR